GCLDDGFHMIEIAVERIAAALSHSVYGLRAAILERLRAREIARLFQLACVSAQVAVADVEQRLELAERELVAHRERAHDSEAHTFVYQPIELGIFRTSRSRNRRELGPLLLWRSLPDFGRRF